MAHVMMIAIRDSKGKARWTTSVFEDVFEKERSSTSASRCSGNYRTGNLEWGPILQTPQGAIISVCTEAVGAAPSIEQLIERVHPDDRQVLTRSYSDAPWLRLACQK